MVKRMLIDAAHAHERRVAVTEGEKLLEFDFETLNNLSRKGNVYLAKVVRVEPSLQAAFLDYGFDRHGFLAFSDIQYSNYQIPVEDREALAAEQERLLEEAGVSEELDDTFDPDDSNGEPVPEEPSDDEVVDDPQDAGEGEIETDYEVEVSGGSAEEPEEERKSKKSKSLLDFYRRYKIQEVIKRGQVMLVQVVKDERGNKGAALTTYISLPGRYCVLMPNAFHKGGVSRKISDAKDRRRLRKIVEDLDMPKNMSLIVRTAGKDRNKADIKRDSEYLMRLWDQIRETTLKSNAPSLIYEEGDIIRQSLRDLYRKDMLEVFVQGDDAYKEAKAYMKQLSPSHASRVKKYTPEPEALFSKYGVENQLSEMSSHEVTLKSGGYLIINHTEALVSIDINSGRATRERNITDTAYKTNLEAAEEIARQVRLRNLAGLVVVDFIDMDNNKHIQSVERKFREAMRDDRARVQIGHISQFGLLEFSRQRLGASYLETITQPCARCKGRGVVPAANLLGLRVLRKVQDMATSARNDGELRLRVHTDAALYLLNSMRSSLVQLEEQLKRSIVIIPDASLSSEDVFYDKPRPIGRAIPEREGEESSRSKRSRSRRRKGRNKGDEEVEKSTPDASDSDKPSTKERPDGEEAAVAKSADAAGEKRSSRKRSRRRRGSSEAKREENSTPASAGTDSVANQADVKPEAPNTKAETSSDETPKRKRAPRRKKKEPSEEKSVDNTDVTASEAKESAESKPAKGRKKKGWWSRLVESEGDNPDK